VGFAFTEAQSSPGSLLYEINNVRYDPSLYSIATYNPPSEDNPGVVGHVASVAGVLIAIIKFI
jgi:hypothetical protein